MPRVNLEGATLRGCSMDERLGVRTNLEGVFVCVCVVLYLHVTLCVSNGRLPNQKCTRQKWKVTL